VKADWRDSAVCRGLDAGEVVPSHCLPCPVKEECFWEAISDVDWHRRISYTPACTWGGKTANARKNLMGQAGFDPVKAFNLYKRGEARKKKEQND
tara:strand:- start:289 stop:573 length:285 start_codon:yes stop_codon:yes gene_type:complete